MDREHVHITAGIMGHFSAMLQLWLGFFPYFCPASTELMSSYDVHASDTAIPTGGKSAVKLVYVFINVNVILDRYIHPSTLWISHFFLEDLHNCK